MERAFPRPRIGVNLKRFEEPLTGRARVLAHREGVLEASGVFSFL
jgi:hypothetical protein